MSRPFSYNDESFTVIGNILFVHVDIGGDAYTVGQTLCTIPQAIFNRMTTYNQQAAVSNKLTGGSGSSIGVTCTEDGNLITRTAITTASTLPRYVFTWYCLKDI